MPSPQKLIWVSSRSLQFCWSQEPGFQGHLARLESYLPLQALTTWALIYPLWASVFSAGKWDSTQRLRKQEEQPTYLHAQEMLVPLVGQYLGGGCIFLWGCILGVALSLLPFLCILITPLPPPWGCPPGPTSGKYQVSVFEGLNFLGSRGQRGTQTALGAAVRPAGYRHGTYPHCSPAYLEWGVQLPKQHTWWSEGVRRPVKGAGVRAGVLPGERQLYDVLPSEAPFPPASPTPSPSWPPHEVPLCLGLVSLSSFYPGQDRQYRAHVQRARWSLWEHWPRVHATGRR